MWTTSRVVQAIRVVAFDHCDYLRFLGDLTVANCGARETRGLTTLFRIQRRRTAHHGRRNFLHLLHIVGFVWRLVWSLAFFVHTECVFTLVDREIKQNRPIRSSLELLGSLCRRCIPESVQVWMVVRRHRGCLAVNRAA